MILLLGCVLLLPNGALWAVAYAAGPGFAVGAGTGISPFGATLGPVPAFPLLAALPGSGTPAPAVRAALLLPVLAGVLAGWVVGRRLPAATGPGRLPALLTGRVARPAGYGLLAGGLVALVTAALAVLAGGALGPGYLAAVGPSRLAGRGRAGGGGRRPRGRHRRPGPGPGTRLRPPTGRPRAPPADVAGGGPTRRPASAARRTAAEPRPTGGPAGPGTTGRRRTGRSRRRPTPDPSG